MKPSKMTHSLCRVDKRDAFERRVIAGMRDAGQPGAGGRAIAAISAGPDSTALLAAASVAAKELGFEIFALHVNHGQRGREAQDDARFARGLAGRLGVPFRAARLTLKKGASEDALREARYAAIAAEARRRRADTALLGHHADDLAETLLMRLIRGAGLEGLAAFGYVEERNGLTLVRPLIGMRRMEILAYLKRRELPWREDSSNEAPAFLRNRIRREVLPLLEAVSHAKVGEALARTAGLLKRDAEFLEELSEREQRRRAVFVEGGGMLDVAGWGDLHVALRTRVVREFLRRAMRGTLPPYRAHIEAMDRLALRGRNGSFTATPGGWVVFRDGARLVAARPETTGRPTLAQAREAARNVTAAQGRLRKR